MTRYRRWKRALERHLRVRCPLALLCVGTLLLARDATGTLRLGLAGALLHELGHVGAYRAMVGRWPVLTLAPWGICLSMRGLWLPPWRELTLAAAGPLANLVCSAWACLLMRHIGASWAGYRFAAANLLIGGANLLPLPGLDGARILGSLRAWPAAGRAGGQKMSPANKAGDSKMTGR